MNLLHIIRVEIKRPLVERSKTVEKKETTMRDYAVALGNKIRQEYYI
ncbi:MAG: hypothetical protein K0S60_893, partial [Evtepia sp.]|nr:hypothetical protein [Evtepia sp.]